MHEVLVNSLGGLSLPRKSVVRLTDRPDMTLDVYRGRKTTMQQHVTEDAFGHGFISSLVTFQMLMQEKNMFDPYNVTSLRFLSGITVMCLSIGTPKSNKFSICSKCKIIFRCPKIWAHYSLIIICSSIGTPKNH